MSPNQIMVKCGDTTLEVNTNLIYYILAGKIIRCNRHKPNAENDD
jgi:hypothetical protein